MKCPKCNATNHEESAIYCHICGTQLRETCVLQIGKDEYYQLCQSKTRLEVLLQKGYAPNGHQLVNDNEYNVLKNSKARLDGILSQGYAPNGKVIIDNTEYNSLKNRHHGEGGSGLLKWLLVCALAIIVILLFLMSKNTTSNVDSKQEVIVPETVVEHTDFPSNLSGNYIARKLNGDNNSNASVKVYQEGRGYAMNVYSSNITRKYTFTYNPSTGEILSDELGSGRARIKGITNETEITFAEWELLK